MNGFAEGFQGGYRMVGDQLADQRKLQLEEENAKKQDAQFEKTLGLHHATLESQKEFQKGQLDHYQKQIDAQERQHKDTIGIQQQQVDRQTDHDKAMIQLQREQNATSRMSAASNAAANNAQANLANWKLNQAKMEQNREEARQRFNQSIITDPKTGQQTLNVVPGQEQQWVDDAKAVGLPMDRIANGIGPYQHDIGILKGALQHPDKSEVRDIHGEKVLGALNRIYSGSINANTGQPYNGTDEKFKGTTVIKKEVVDIVPEMDKSGKPVSDDHHFIIREYYGDKNGKPIIGKDGKPLSSEGPATEGRDNDPHAPVKKISVEQMIGSLNAHQSLIDTLKAHPEEYNMIQDLMRQRDAEMQKGKGGKYHGVVIKGAVDEKGNQQPDTLEMYNDETGLTIDQKRMLDNPLPQRQQDAEQQQQPGLATVQPVTNAQPQTNTDPAFQQAKIYLKYGPSGDSQAASKINSIRNSKLPDDQKLNQIAYLLQHPEKFESGGGLSDYGQLFGSRK